MPWKASFKWLIITKNMKKVLNDKYRSNYKKKKVEVKNKFHNFEQRTYDYQALEQFFINKTNNLEQPKNILERLELCLGKKNKFEENNTKPNGKMWGYVV